MGKNGEGSWEKLPPDILSAIADYLPTRDKVTCCGVCNNWCLAINELNLRKENAVCLLPSLPQIRLQRTVYLFEFYATTEFQELLYDDEQADEVHIIISREVDEDWAICAAGVIAGWGARRLVLDGAQSLPPTAADILLHRLPLWVDHLDIVGWNRALWDKLTEGGVLFSSLTLSGRGRVTAWYPGRPGARTRPVGLESCMTLFASCAGATSDLLMYLAVPSLTRIRLDEVNSLNEASLKAFADLPNLTTLAIHGAFSTPDAAWASAISSGLPVIADLSINNCPGFGDMALLALADRTSLIYVQLDISHLAEGSPLFLPSSASHIVLEVPHSRHFVAQAHIHLEETPLSSLELQFRPPFADPLLHVQLQLLAELAAAKRTAFSYRLLRNSMPTPKLTTYW